MSSEYPIVVIQTPDATIPVPATNRASDPFSSMEGSPRRRDSESRRTTVQNPVPPPNIYIAPPRSGRHEEGSTNRNSRELQYIASQAFHTSQKSLPGSPRTSDSRHPDARPQTHRRSTRETHTSIYIDPKHISGSSDMISKYRYGSLEERLRPTIESATEARKRYARTARIYSWLHNAAIGLQVLLGSLTTGLSAVAATSGKSSAVQTTILGGISTVVASYLAKANSSNEPELSNTRVKDLDQFLRDCDAFIQDHGHVITEKDDEYLNEELKAKRKRLEEIFGNTVNFNTDRMTQTTLTIGKLASPA